MFNIIIGLYLLYMGLTRRGALIFTDSPELLAAIGAVLVVWGVTQVVRRRRAEAEYQQQREDRNPTPEFNPPPDDSN